MAFYCILTVILSHLSELRFLKFINVSDSDNFITLAKFEKKNIYKSINFYLQLNSHQHLGKMRTKFKNLDEILALSQ